MKRYIIIALSALTLASCSFLEEVNPTGITKVFENEALLETNANGLYSYPLMSSCSFLENYGAASGLWIFGQPGATIRTSSDYTSCHRFTIYPTHNYNKENFKNFYLSAGRANMLIENLKESPVSEDYKREIEAEAKFVRAVSYFWIVRVFGDCPLRIEAPTSEDASYCPRTPYYKIYAQIIEDLKFAEQYMRTPDRMNEIAPTQCRPNKFAATAYLSSVYVTIGSLLAHPDDNFWDTTNPERLPDFSACGINSASDAYTKALECAERVLPESSTHDPECKYALVEKISDLYQFTPEFSRNGYNSYKNPEQIFVYSMSRSSNATITFSRNTLPKCCPGTDAATNTGATNWGRTRPSRFFHQKWARTYPGKFGTGDFASVVQECADPRMEAVMFCKPFQNGIGETVTMYPYVLTAQQVNFTPYLKKYWCCDYNGGTTSNASVYYMRLAEVYFNAAEAAAFLGNEELARKYVEVIHARARHSVPDGQPDAAQPVWSSAKTFENADELITAIFWERQFELCGENQEYMDTHRFGATWLSENIAKPLNDFITEPANSKLFGQFYDGTPRRIYEEDADLLRNSLLSKIPQAEIDTNSAIADNSNDFDWDKQAL